MYFSKFSDWRYVGACTACVGIAMLCKEQGITVTGVCVVYEIFVAQRVSNISDCLSAESFSNNLLRKKANVFLILSYLMLIETLPHIPRCRLCFLIIIYDGVLQFIWSVMDLSKENLILNLRVEYESKVIVFSVHCRKRNYNKSCF